MRKIFLCVPPPGENVNWRISHSPAFPHLGVGYIAAGLKRAGFTVRVCDAPAEKVTFSKLEAMIRGFSPDIVGVTSFTSQIYEAGRVAEIAKKVDPRILTVAGGAHVSAAPERTLREFAAFDAAVIGEGEEAVVNIARFAGADNSIPGIAYRRGGEIIVTGSRQPVEDLDTIAFPAHELFSLESYRSLNSLFGRKRTLPVLSSRGCSYKCRFCFSLLGKNVRFRSVGNVADEIERDISLFGANVIFFQDETFTIDRKRAIRLCEEFLKRELNKKVEWVCETRVDAVDGELLALMRKAGCTLINYGIESGSQDILDAIRKDITLEQAEAAVARTKENKIRVYTNFLIGHPFETRRSIGRTIRFALKLKADFASFSILTPFPGTEISDMAAEGTGGLRLLSLDWREYGTQFGRALELDTISRQELEDFQKSAYFSFYSRHLFNVCKIIDFRAFPVYLYEFFLKRHGRKAINVNRTPAGIKSKLQE